jgi:2-phosphosulfolactate phosphatase
MQIDLYLTPQQADELGLREKTVVMIDVLRSSTTIVTALASGARQVIPATSVESAVKISGNLFGDVFLLGGERNGKMIAGFTLGNSPLEYTEERVRGKSIIFSSSNGTQALARGRHARTLLVCGFVNVSAVAAALQRTGGDVTILCAGNDGSIALEDAVCAGMLIHRAAGWTADTVGLSDGASVALSLYKTHGKTPLKMLQVSDHGRLLTGLGFGDDLRVCAGVDTHTVVPHYEAGVLKPLPQARAAATSVSLQG